MNFESDPSPKNLQSTLIFKAGRHSGLWLARLTAEREYSLLFLELSPNALRPHSTGGLSARHSAKGQTGNLSVTHDAATTPWPQIHQGSVTFEFTGVISCSKTHRLFLEGRPCYLIKDRKWTHFWTAIFFFFSYRPREEPVVDMHCSQTSGTWLVALKPNVLFESKTMKHKQEPEGEMLWGYANKTLGTKGITGACNWHHVLLFSKHHWPCSA